MPIPRLCGMVGRWDNADARAAFDSLQSASHAAAWRHHGHIRIHKMPQHGGIMDTYAYIRCRSMEASWTHTCEHT